MRKNFGHQKMDSYPFRPMDNKERRAAWASVYYLNYTPFQHPTGEEDQHEKSGTQPNTEIT